MSVKLLIADDEDTIRKGMAKYIQLHTDRFSQIYEAENGQEAIDLLLKYQPEILLLDVQMPLKNGIDVMAAAKAADLHPVTVILSGYDEFAYAQQALKYGAKEYLLKPTRAADVLKTLLKLTEEYIEPETDTFDAEENSRQEVSRAQKYIAEHYHEEIALADVAEHVGISPGYMSTLFSRDLGLGFVEYLNRVRVERACAYLRQSYLKTYEIAYRVGFRDEKYFSKVFKKMMGMSPKEYKQAKTEGQI